jgi:hypothetical protein
LGLNVPILNGKLVPKSAPKQEEKKTAQKAPQRAPTLTTPLGIEKDTPHSDTAEWAILGCLIQQNKLIPQTYNAVTPAHFFNPINRDIYNTIIDMWKAQMPCGLLELCAYMEDHGTAEKVGGRINLTQLVEWALVPENIGFHIELVRRKYFDRLSIQTGLMLQRKGFGAQDEESDDLLGQYARSLDRLRQAAGGANGTLADATQFLNGNLPPLPNEIIYRILHEGSKMIVGGTSKGRKTMALIDANVSVATGTPWWGFNTRRGPVCYINFEIQDGFFWYRVDQICKAKGVSIDPGMFFAWNLRGRADGIENLLEEILAVLQQKPFVLVTIDPVYKALGNRDENRAGDVASMLNEIEKIAVQTGAAVAFGAHYSKGNQAMKESVDRIGGSGVFARDPDTILTMTAHEKEECFTVEGTLRNFAPMYPFVVKWDWPLFVREDADPNDLKKARGSKSQFVPQYKITELKKTLDDEEGMTKSTFYRFRQELLSEGLIEEKDGEMFKISKIE